VLRTRRLCPRVGLFGHQSWTRPRRGLPLYLLAPLWSFQCWPWRAHAELPCPSSLVASSSVVLIFEQVSGGRLPRAVGEEVVERKGHRRREPWRAGRRWRVEAVCEEVVEGEPNGAIMWRPPVRRGGGGWTRAGASVSRSGRRVRRGEVFPDVNLGGPCGYRGWVAAE
jgi:hypothetical protein